MTPKISLSELYTLPLATPPCHDEQVFQVCVIGYIKFLHNDNNLAFTIAWPFLQNRWDND